MVIAAFALKVSSTMMICAACPHVFIFINTICVCVFPVDKGGDGGDSGGGAGAAGSERSPPEVKGGLPRQVSGAGPAQEGRSSTERSGEGRWSPTSLSSR